MRLELIDELDLAVEERLVAAGQVDEDVADALAEQGGLLLGHLDGHLLDRVERVGQLADLVLRVDVDRDHRSATASASSSSGFRQPLHQGGQLLGGEPVGGLGELGQRPGDRAGDHHGDGEGDGQAHGAGGEVEQDRAGCRLLLVAGGVETSWVKSLPVWERPSHGGDAGRQGVGPGDAEHVPVEALGGEVTGHPRMPDRPLRSRPPASARGGAAPAHALLRPRFGLGGLLDPGEGLAVDVHVGADDAGAVGEGALWAAPTSNMAWSIWATRSCSTRAMPSRPRRRSLSSASPTAEGGVHTDDRAGHVAVDLADGVGLGGPAVDAAPDVAQVVEAGVDQTDAAGEGAVGGTLVEALEGLLVARHGSVGAAPLLVQLGHRRC